MLLEKFQQTTMNLIHLLFLAVDGATAIEKMNLIVIYILIVAAKRSNVNL